MRGHPLIGRLIPSAGGVLVGTLLIGCASGASTVPTAPATAVSIMITTAAGDRLAFEPMETAVGAPGPVQMRFRNGSTLPHNLVFASPLTAATRTIVPPGTSDQLTVVLPAPGTYPFVCTIHDGMSGAVVVDATRSQGPVESAHAHGDVGARH